MLLAQNLKHKKGKRKREFQKHDLTTLVGKFEGSIILQSIQNVHTFKGNAILSQP